MCNPWLLHVNDVREKNPTISYKQALQLASKSYTKTTAKPHTCRKCKAAAKNGRIQGGEFNDNMDELKTGLRASYKTNDEADALLQTEGYQLDHALSGQRAKVFVKNGKPYISFRGTQNRHDVVNDGLAYLGVEKTKRLAHTKKVVNAVRAKYGGQEPTVIGHSYGAMLSEQSGTKGEIITYNKLATGRTKGNKNQIDVRDSADPASMITKLIAPSSIKKISIKSKSWNPLTNHSMRGLKNRNVVMKK